MFSGTDFVFVKMPAITAFEALPTQGIHIFIMQDTCSILMGGFCGSANVVAGGGEGDDTADSDTTGGGVVCSREVLHMDDDELLLSNGGELFVCRLHW
jgi:hypothetical protein